MTTNYIIGHLPHGSSGLTDNHGAAVGRGPHQTDDWLADLVRVDEMVAFGHSRLCCDIGVYMRAPDGPASNLISVLDQHGQRLKDEPSEEQVVEALVLAREHVLRLRTRIEHSRVWLSTIVVDLVGFDRESGADADARPARDICLGFNDDLPPPIILAMKAFFEERGLSVGLNEPVSGCLLPFKYIGDHSVIGMTLGVNRRLHEDVQIVTNSEERRDRLRALFEALYSLLSSFACRSS